MARDGFVLTWTATETLLCGAELQVPERYSDHVSQVLTAGDLRIRSVRRRRPGRRGRDRGTTAQTGVTLSPIRAAVPSSHGVNKWVNR